MIVKRQLERGHPARPAIAHNPETSAALAGRMPALQL